MDKDKIWHLFARKLTGEASSEELQELEILIKEEEELHFELQILSSLWEHEGQVDLDYIEATYLIHKERMRKEGVTTALNLQTEISKNILKEAQGKWGVKAKKLLVGSLFAAIVITAGIVFFNVKSKKDGVPFTDTAGKTQAAHEIVTARGSTVTQFKLPDGSVVRMNADSKLNFEKINSAEGIREVYLTGEAFFDVVRNPDRPFIIHTATIDVKVLGTSFNVKAYPGDKTTETSLISGSVEVFIKKRGNERHLLKPNEKLVVLNNLAEEKIQSTPTLVKQESVPLVAIQKLTYKNGEPLAVEAAWTENKLSFVDKPFAELALEMERWYNVKIIFLNNKTAQFHFSATFKDETVVQAIEALKFSQDFKYSYIKDSILIE